MRKRAQSSADVVSFLPFLNSSDIFEAEISCPLWN